VANLSLAKLPWHVQIAAMVAIALGVGGAFYYFYEMPQQVQIAAQAKELSDIRGRISKGQAMARQLPEFRKEIGVRSKRGSSRSSRFFPTSAMWVSCSGACRRWRRSRTCRYAVSARRRSRPRDLHAEWPIALQLEGNYHNLGLFLDRVSKFPRIINIGSMKIASKDEPTPQSSMTINATATTVRAGRYTARAARRSGGQEGREEGAGQSAGEEEMTKAVRSIQLLICVAALTVAMPSYAQAKKTEPKAKADEKSAPAAEPVKKVDLPVPPPNFEYTPQGRRDPFISLVNRGKDQSAQNGGAWRRNVRRASPGCSPAN
jgi:type IV pilus assembly protein PilO